MRYAWLVPVLGLLGGCPFSFTNEEHCAAQAGDATCASADPSTPYCALDGCGLYDEVQNRSGCVAELPEKMSCYSPCGGKQDANASSDCEAVATGSTSAGSTTSEASGSTTTRGGAETDDATTDGCGCEADAPICVEGECVPCETDAQCGEAFPDEREFCQQPACQACASRQAFPGAELHAGCGDGLPNCVGGACVPICLVPDDCPVGGCEARAGVCGPSDRIVFVNPGGSDDADGTVSDPVATIGEAITRIPPVTEGLVYSIGTVVLAPGVYTESVAFAGRNLVLRASDPSDPPILRSPDEAPMLTLLRESEESEDQAILSVHGVHFVGSPDVVIQLEFTTALYADDVEMVGNGRGIVSDGGTAIFRNSIIAETTGAPFAATDTSTFAAVQSTLVQNDAAVWFDCTGEGSDTEVTLEDSIVGAYPGGSELVDLVSPECQLAAPAERNVSGANVVMSAFRDAYRLDVNPGEAFELPDAAFCGDEGTGLPGDSICRSPRGIDGGMRAFMDPEGTRRVWAGANVP